MHATRVFVAVFTLVLGTACRGDDDAARGTTRTAPTAVSFPSSTTGPAPTSTRTETTTTIVDEIEPSASAVWPKDFPDPFVLSDGDRYYAYATEAGIIRIQRLQGSSPRHWEHLGEALSATPTWAAPFSTWAPSVLPRGDQYVLYYAALVAGTDMHCIGRATADNAIGPFTDSSEQPFLCPTDLGGAIDPSPFIDKNGRAYLLWKNDGVTRRREANVWSLPLDDDGTATGEPSAFLIATDQAWEFPHVEAPSMTRINEVYWLAYSGNWWNQAAYGVGLARCSSPLGPCVKPFDGPVLSSRPGALGPGGLEFFRDRDGSLFVAYHAWPDTPGYPGMRALWIEHVDTSGATPVIPR